MKTRLMSKFPTRMLILTFLLVSLVGVGSSGNIQQATATLPCCSYCTGDAEVPWEDQLGLANYCTDQCGGDNSGVCFYDCRNEVLLCWSSCSSSC
jgi:hypothetical protein